MARAVTMQMRLPLFPRPRCPWCGGPLVVGEGMMACVLCSFAQAR